MDPSVDQRLPAPSPGRRHRVLLAALLAFALAVRVGWAAAQPADDRSLQALPDQVEYLSLARNLVSGWGLHFYDARFQDVSYAFRTPGYPLWVAAFAAKVRVVRVAQAVLDTSTVLAVYLLARSLLRNQQRNQRRSKGAALVAAALAAVSPLLISFSGLLLSETLFTALLAWGMLLLVVGGNGGRLGDGSADPARPPKRFMGLVLWLGGGMLLALSALVRPSALPLPTLLGIAAVFLGRPENRPNRGAYQGDVTGGSGPTGRAVGSRATTRERSEPGERNNPRPSRESATWPPRRWPLPVGATMLLLTLLVVAPWAYRNWVVLGRWVWTTTNEGVTAYDGFNPDATGASDQSFLRFMPQLQRMGEVDRSRYLAEKAETFIREHPGRAAELAGAKVKRTWSPVPLSREYGDWKHAAVLLAYTLPLDLLVLAGLVGPLAGGLRPAAKVFLLTPAVYLTCVHAMSIGSLRYRIPAEPLMAVVAGGVVGRRRGEVGGRQ